MPEPVTKGGTPLTLKHCVQLFACYYEITKQVCAGSQPGECKTKLEIKGNPSDDDCKRMLLDVDGVLMPMKMVKPGLKKPSRCIVE